MQNLHEILWQNSLLDLFKWRWRLSFISRGNLSQHLLSWEWKLQSMRLLNWKLLQMQFLVQIEQSKMCGLLWLGSRELLWRRSQSNRLLQYQEQARLNKIPRAPKNNLHFGNSHHRSFCFLSTYVLLFLLPMQEG